MQGAAMLSENSADSIAEIAGLCGFDSPSNFAKTFKRFYHCTLRIQKYFPCDLRIGRFALFSQKDSCTTYDLIRDQKQFIF